MKKKYILFLFLFSFSLIPVQATDYTVLEALIKAHKNQSNKLKERTANDAALLGIAIKEEDSMNKYEKIVKSLGNRVNDVFSYIAFAGEVSEITVLTKDVIDKEKKIVEFASKYAIKEPRIAIEIIKIEREFGNTIKEVVNITEYVVAGGIGVTLATQKDRMEFTSRLINLLSTLKRKMDNSLYYCRVLTYMNQGLTGKLQSGWKLIETIIPEKKQEELVKSIKQSFKKNMID